MKRQIINLSMTLNFMLLSGFVIFFSFRPSDLIIYNLELRSYNQLLPLFNYLRRA